MPAITRNLSRRARRLLAVASFGAAPFAVAQPFPATVSWDSGAGTLNWGDALNWSNNAVPGDNNEVHFGTNVLTGGGVINLGGTTRRFANLYFDDARFLPTRSFTIANGTLRAVANPYNHILLWASYGNSLTVNAPIVLESQGSYQFVIGGTDMTINSSITKADPARAINLEIGSMAAPYTVRVTSPVVGHNNTVITSANTVAYDPGTGGTYSFGSGRISTSPDATFSFRGATSQDYVLTNAFDGPTIDLHTRAGSPRFKFTGAINTYSAYGLKIRTTGTNAAALLGDFQGRLTLGSNDPVSVTNGTTAPIRYSGSIGESIAGRTLRINLDADAPFVVAGTNNTYTGGTIVGGNPGRTGYVDVAVGSVLGTGDATVEAGGRLRLNAVANLAAGRTVLVNPGGLVEFATGIGYSAALAKVNPTSAGVFGLLAQPTGLDLDAASQPTLFVGSGTSTAVTATWKPYRGEYRLAGALSGTFTVAAANVLGGATNRLTFGSASNNGTAAINQPQNFGGGADVAGGTLFANVLGALGTGTVRVSGGTLVAGVAGLIDPAKVVIAGGNLRLPRADALLNANPLSISGGSVEFDKGATTGTVAYNTSLAVSGSSGAFVKVIATAANTQVSLNNLALGAYTLGFAAAPGSAPTGVAVDGSTTFAPGAAFDVQTVAASADNKGVFAALNGPVTATTPGAPLVKTGPGTLGLYNAANAFTGVVANGGLVAFAQDAALGSAGGRITLAGGGVRYAGNVDYTLARPLTLAAPGGTIDASGANGAVVTVPAPNELRADARGGVRALTLAGAGTGRFDAPLRDVGDPTALVKAGPGTWTVGPDNAHTGGTTVNDGVLRIAGPGSLGAGPLTVTGGVLDLNGHSATVGALAGTGGIIRNGGGSPVTFTAIIPASTSTTSFAGALQDAAAPLGFAKAGAGSLALTGVSTYSGPTTVSGGTLDLGETGRLPNTTSLHVAGGRLVAAPTATAGTPALLKSGIPLTLGGRLRGGGTLDVRPAEPVTLNFGTLTLGAGANVIGVTSQARLQTVFSATGLAAREAGAALDFRGLAPGTSGTVAGPRFTAPPPLTNGILGGGVTFGQNDWATVDGAGNVVAYTGYVNTPSMGTTDAWLPQANVHVDASVSALVPDRTVNSVRVRGGATSPRLIVSGTLTIGTGGLLDVTAAGTNRISGNGTLAVGPGAPDLVVHTPASAATTDVHARVDVGDKALTKVGAGTLSLRNTSNRFGEVFVNGGTLQLWQNGVLGASTAPIHLYGNGAAVRVESTNQAVVRPLVVGAGGGTVQMGSALSLALTGGGTLAGNLTLSGAAMPAHVITLSGGLSGPGSLTLQNNTSNLSSAFRLELNGANSFAGGVVLNPGYPERTTLAVGSDAALGSGPLVVKKEVAVEFTNGPRTIPNPVRLESFLKVYNAQDVTFNGPLTLAGDGPHYLDLHGAGVVTLNGPVVDGGAKKMLNTRYGALVLAGANTVSALGVNGPVRLTGTLASDTNVYVSAPGVFEIDTPVVRLNQFGAGGTTRLAPGGTKLLVFRDIWPTSNFGIDLTDNALAYDYTPGWVDHLRGYILSGRAGGAWTGSGIRSSTAAADPRLAVGFGPASDLLGPAGGTFMGQPVDATSFLVRATLKGDATLDGVVDFADLVKLAQNYNTTGGLWHTGDFTYDGIVDFNDLVSLAQNYNASLPAGPIPGAASAFASDLSAAFASVPEPGVLCPVALAGYAVGSRRRRRRR